MLEEKIERLNKRIIDANFRITEAAIGCVPDTYAISRLVHYTQHLKKLNTLKKKYEK